jgi:hypothetical protein
MDKLLALISEIGQDDDEDTVIRLASVTWSGAGMELGLEVSTYNLGEKSRHLQIRCEDVLTYALTDQAASSLELTGSHAVLWRFTYDSAKAFFYGAPADANAAVGALYEKHRQAAGDWFGLETYINRGVELRELLSAGNGLLAEGPLPILTVYKDVLAQYGVQVEIGSPYPPGGRMSHAHVQQRLRTETKALLIGESYIIGLGWTGQVG